MLFSHILYVVLSALVLSPMSLTQAAPTPEGTLAVVSGDELTFSYSTSDPYGTNWVGLYLASGGGPVNEEFVSQSLSWKYAPEAQGTVKLDVGNLAAGEYVAFFLSRDGYKWLAEPVNVSLKGSNPTAFGFIVEKITSHNGRQGDSYKAKFGGLITAGYKATFDKVSGDDWVQVGTDGTISGTPDRARDAVVTVRATTSDGESSTLVVSIPVKRSGSAIVQEFKVMTFNLWYGGTQVKDYHNKQVRFIVDTNVDIIGFQEASGGHAQRLADALGWYFWQPGGGDLGTISRYPIVADYGLSNASGGVRIALDGTDSQVNFWNMHLGYNPYGPYDFCFDKMSVERVLQREAQSGRTPQIFDTLNTMDPQIKESWKVPVILVGDTNAPSHLDWTEELRSKNCGYANVPWPSSVKPTQAGLIDSFRVANPDPVAVPGVTWSPLYPFHNGATGQAEPQDRIDFIYHTGKLQVLSSKTAVVGEPKPHGSHQDNEWTSDHAVVITTYRLQL